MSEVESKGRVLLVEDDRANRYAIAHMLRAEGIEVDEATCAAEAIELLAHDPSCVILDWVLPDGDGERVMRHIRSRGLAARVVVVTVAYEDRIDEINAFAPHAVFPKPFDAKEVLRSILPCADH